MVFICLGGSTTWLVAVGLLAEPPQRALWAQPVPGHRPVSGCPVRLPSSICLSVCVAAVIRSEADKPQFVSAEEDAEQETLSRGPVTDGVFFVFKLLAFVALFLLEGATANDV